MGRSSWQRRLAWTVPALVLAAALGAGVPGFPDLQNHWSRSTVVALAARGLVNGFPDGTFRPYDQVTRAQFAKLLAQATGQEQAALLAVAAGSRFPDLKGHWAAAYVEAAAEKGLIYGYPDGTFGPERPVTRLEAVVLTARAAGLEAAAQAMPADAALPYPDAALVPAWARGLVWAAAADGLPRELFPAGFSPERPLTRAEAAALTARLAARYGSYHHLSGIVRAWNPDVGLLTVETPAGEMRHLTLTPDALTFRFGAPARSFWPLDQVWLLLAPDGRVTYAEARFRDVLGGNVNVRGNTLQMVEGGTGRVRRLTVAAAAKVFLNGRPAALADIAGAQQAYAVLDDNTGEVRIVDAVRYTHYGRIYRVEPRLGTISLVDRGRSLQFQVPPAAVLFRDGERVTLADLESGEVAMVEATGGQVRFLQIDR